MARGWLAIHRSLNSEEKSRSVEFMLNMFFVTELSLENKVRMRETYNNNFTKSIVRTIT